MIVIYDQEKTYLKNDADEAKEVLLTLYGEKLGEEAYAAIKDAPIRTAWRKHGGPLVQVVDEEKAKWICKHEFELLSNDDVSKLDKIGHKVNSIEFDKMKIEEQMQLLMDYNEALIGEIKDFESSI